ncbi:MAG TPA: hypothetical protein RMG48_10025 [Myxococcales bacterium LLY-WYZ-16_1]|nr:hypothetical protein [Myxococcales bacterium LLY-WYZ-16_1]
MNPIAALGLVGAVAGWGLGAARLGRVVAGVSGWSRLTGWVLGFWTAFGGLTVSVAVGGRLGRHTEAGIHTALAGGILVAVWARRHWSEFEPRPLQRSAWLPLVLVLSSIFLLFVKLVSMYQIFDEWGLLGHKAIIEQMGRGVFPPRWPFAFGEEARYHYGVDVLVGALRYGFGGTPGWTADAWTDRRVVLLAVAVAGTAAAVATEVDSRARPWVAALAVHFGAGLAFLLYAWVEAPDSYCLIQYACAPEMVPSQFANFWQHPVSVGAGCWLAGTLGAWAVLRVPPRALGPATLVTGTVWALAAVSQVVFFGLGVLSIASVLPLLRPRERSWIRVTVLLGTFGAALGLAVLAGGMFAPSDRIESGLFRWRQTLGYPADVSLQQRAFFFVANLGLPLLSWPWMAWVAWRRRCFVTLSFLSFGFGGILACQLFVYTRSWDIVKFPSAAMFALTMAWALRMDPAWVRWPWLRRAGAVAVMGGGLLVAASFLYPWPPNHRPYPLGHRRPDPRTTAAIRYLSPRVGEQLVLAQNNIVRQLSIFGGLPVVGFDVDLYYMGVARRVYQPLQSDVRVLERTLDPATLRRRNVGYLVYSDEEIRNLGPVARRRLLESDGFRVVLTIPPDRPDPGRRRRVWRVLDSTEPEKTLGGGL